MTEIQFPWPEPTSLYDDDGPHTPDPVKFEAQGHRFLVQACPLHMMAPDTMRTRYRVECLSCGVLLHEATTGASIRVEQHLEKSTLPN